MSSTLAATRRSLHGVAEAVVAGPQYRATGTLRLRQRPGGFGTIVSHGGFSLVAVVGTDLVVSRSGGGSSRLPLTGTIGALAAAAGLPFGGLEGVYGEGSGPTPDQVLEVDPDAAAELAAAFAAGSGALRSFAAPAGLFEQPVLWPEHFDLAIALDGVQYGVSAGDDTIPAPYAYVSPMRPRKGPFWDRPLGAARPLWELPGESAIVSFFAEGRAHSRTPDRP